MALALAAGLAGCASAPDWAPTVGIWGHIRDPLGRPVCARFDVFRPDGSSVYGERRGGGRICHDMFSVDLEPGQYRLHAIELGYEIFDLDVTVAPASATYIDVRLEPRAPIGP